MFDFSLRGSEERVQEPKDPFPQHRLINRSPVDWVSVSDSSLLARLFTILGSGPCAGVSAFPTGWRLEGS